MPPAYHARAARWVGVTPPTLAFARTAAAAATRIMTASATARASVPLVTMVGSGHARLKAATTHASARAPSYSARWLHRRRTLRAHHLPRHCRLSQQARGFYPTRAPRALKNAPCRAAPAMRRVSRPSRRPPPCKQLRLQRASRAPAVLPRGHMPVTRGSARMADVAATQMAMASATAKASVPMAPAATSCARAIP